MQTVLIGIAAFLIGSISFAVVVSKLLGLPDPRSYGSKNPGATNVLRSGSKLAAALTLIGDTGKGAFAVGLAALYTGESALTGVDVPLAGASAFFRVVGDVDVRPAVVVAVGGNRAHGPPAGVG